MADNHQIRCALIGCGMQMRENLVPFLHRLNRAKVVACVDPNETLARELAQVTGTERWTSDVRELDLATIDAAIVAVPPEPSFDIAHYLAKHQIACLVEKPAGPSTAALESLCQTALENKTYVQVGFNFRYTEAISYLYRASHEHRQEPFSLTIDFFSRHPSGPQWGRQNTVDAWFRHNGVHALDLAQWLVASPIEHVHAYLVAQHEHKFLCNILLHHNNNAVTLLRAGNQTKDFIIRLDLLGKDGSRYRMPGLESVFLDMDAGRSSDARLFGLKNLDHGLTRSGFGPELQQFFDVVLTKTLPDKAPPTLEDAYKASQLCDKILDTLGISSSFSS